MKLIRPSIYVSIPAFLYKVNTQKSKLLKKWESLVDYFEAKKVELFGYNFKENQEKFNKELERTTPEFELEISRHYLNKFIVDNFEPSERNT